MNEIAIWLLAVSLIFPRISLLIAWFGGQIPHNDIPFIGDALLAVLLPRVLMLIYIGTNLGVGNVWFIIHAIVLGLVALGSIAQSNSYSKSK